MTCLESKINLFCWKISDVTLLFSTFLPFSEILFTVYSRKPHSFITAAVASAQRNPFVTAKLPITIIDQTETIIQPRNGHTITEGDLTSNTAAEEELTEPPTEITATLTTEGVAEEITEEITESNAEKAEKTAELTTATKLPFVTSEVTEIVTVTEAPTSTTTESFEPFKTVDLPQFFGARIDAAPISRTRGEILMLSIFEDFCV